MSFASDLCGVTAICAVQRLVSQKPVKPVDHFTGAGMVQCDPIAETLGRRTEIAPLGEWMSTCDSSLTAKRFTQAQEYEGVQVRGACDPQISCSGSPSLFLCSHACRMILCDQPIAL